MAESTAPDAQTATPYGPLPDRPVNGDPLTLAAELLRDQIELEGATSENFSLISRVGATGALEEACCSIECGDYFSARHWLSIAIEAALLPVELSDKGKNRKHRQVFAQFQRERLLLVARVALHLILASLQGEGLAEPDRSH